MGFNSFFRKKLGSLDNSTIANDENLLAKVLKYVKSLSPAKKEKDSKNWANRFAGAWKDDRTAEEIISGIRECRTTNSREIEL